MSKALQAIYGPGIGELLMEDVRSSNADSFDADDLEALPPVGDTGRLTMHLRRKRQAALMKQMLKNGGYGDLAKMVSLRQGG